MLTKAEKYSTLAQVYSHLMRKVTYDKWAEYLTDLIDPFFDETASVLEIAGGNGSLANHLSINYKNYILTDLSIEMLKSNLNNRIKSITCDMTQLPFKRKFDVVVCAFDSVNYILIKKKLAKLFTEVYNVLNENGIFLFDVSLEKNSRRHALKKYRPAKFKQIRYEQNSYLIESKRLHVNDFKITLPDGKVFNEKHYQKIFRLNDYFYAIEKAKLYVCDCYENFGNRIGKETSPRVQFVVRKG
ncbi:MAG: class I SAM-dependent methyltransferase [Ignavibacteria bacterium]|nr:class I SAM-dependent methyltransferase [Ignavibacteria bacterium]MDP3832136.1 class I SAM-dependent methyltransferase [Ignavibacteriaceae bacterium]